jgi:hypothetical protein
MNFEFIPAWANVIAQFEGFNSPGTRPARNHNPGDLKFAGQAGAIGRDSAGFAIFPDDATGFQALYAQLAKYVADFPQYSLLEIMAHYLGQSSPGITSQGNAYQYAAAVASALNAQPTTTLAELAGMQPGPPTIDAMTGETIDTMLPPSEAAMLDPTMLAAGASAIEQPTGLIIGVLLIGALVVWFALRS